MRILFLSLPLAVAYEKVETAHRAANRAATSTCIVTGLLWLWARAPSFDVIPALASIGLRFGTFLTYGFSAPPAGSFINNAIHYINLGYGIVYGPLLITLLVWGWHSRELQLARETQWLLSHPDIIFAKSAQRNKLQVRFGPGGIAFRGIIVLFGYETLFERFMDFRAAPSTAIDAQGCRSENTWHDPWPGAMDPISWWFPPSRWCVDNGGGMVRTFKAVLPDKFFENQLRASELTLPGGEPHGPAMEAITRLLSIQYNPYENFPYVYPTPWVWASTLCLLLILLAVIHIISLRLFPEFVENRAVFVFRRGRRALSLIACWLGVGKGEP